MSDSEKVLTYEEAKELCKKAFDGGVMYEATSAHYNVNAVAYDWDHWLKDNEGLFRPKPTVEAALGRGQCHDLGGTGANGAQAALCARIDGLCQENEQLRQRNAKLRKLVDGITFCSTTSSRSDDCIGCPLLDQSTHNYRCTKTECMRDLGIEVE